MPRASAIDRELLRHTLRAQYGVIARSQAMACGLTVPPARQPARLSTLVIPAIVDRPPRNTTMINLS